MVAFNSAAVRLPAPESRGVGAATAVPVQDDPAVIGRIGFGRLAAPAGIDRRVHPRSGVSLRVGGRRLDHSVEAAMRPHLNLNLKDVSVGGLRAASQDRLRVGERVSVFFPPVGNSHGWDAHGRVLRVEAPCDTGAACTVAVEFDGLPAA